METALYIINIVIMIWAIVFLINNRNRNYQKLGERMDGLGNSQDNLIDSVKKVLNELPKDKLFVKEVIKEINEYQINKD